MSANVADFGTTQADPINMQYEATVEMTLTPYMEKLLIESFGLEIEVMQGERVELADGRARITITVHDLTKGELLRAFVLRCIANAEQPPQSQ
jgi:hypothetical protein